MKSVSLKFILVVLLIGAVMSFSWVVFSRLQEPVNSRGRHGGPRPVPVEVVPIQRGPIVSWRTFNGALEARAAFVVAPKVSGRIERLAVDLADTVARGQVVAELDSDEYVQALAQAEADLVVAQANLAEAESALATAIRELGRFQALRGRGIASESQFDSAGADQLAKQAKLKVAKAQVTRAESALKTANIRFGYTQVTAGWNGGNEQRVVAERYVDEGETVSANTPLLSIVEIDPIIGVIFVVEKDYARLHPGQPVVLITDAYPGERFEGQIDRIAPVFQQTTRQARVELTIDNPRRRLKPGMFIRATVALDHVPEATIIPNQALTTRNDRTGVFIVSENGRSVTWREVKVGIQEGERVQVSGEGLSGWVVTLGQQLVDDGSAITIPGEMMETAGNDEPNERL